MVFVFLAKEKQACSEQYEHKETWDRLATCQACFKPLSPKLQGKAPWDPGKHLQKLDDVLFFVQYEMIANKHILLQDQLYLQPVLSYNCFDI